MASVASPSLVRQFEILFDGGCAAGLSDRQLLGRFTARSEPADQAAFAAIVARHGPMVLAICRQLLGDHHHAEDAFQAVFLVLARRAGSIRDPDLLGTWLYGVALRTARKARRGIARRRRTEEQGAVRQSAAGPGLRADCAIIDREQAEALHGEIERLPGAFRVPVVLCYFDGLTLDEAAHRLQWPVGTLRSRLARAREKLRRGLMRRGFVLSSSAMAAALAHRPAAASISPLLCETTTRRAIEFAASHAAGCGLSTFAAAFAREVVGALLLEKLKATALCLLLLASLATGAGYLSHAFNGVARIWEGAPPGEPRSHPARTEPRAPTVAASGAAIAQDDPRARPGRMTVAGRVLGPQGKPVPGARVAVLANRKRQVGDREGGHRNILMATAAAAADGRFVLEFPAIPAQHLEHLGLTAAAPGQGLTAVDLKIDAARQETSIALAPEQPALGRLVDVQGQPAAGVVIRVAKLDFQHPLEPYDAEGEPSLWPSPVTTGRDGRFRMLGLGAGASPTFEVDDPRYAHQRFSLHATGAGNATDVLRPNSTVTLRPAQAFDVQVVHADDGTPAVGAQVTVQSIDASRPKDDIAQGRTDGQGRARVVAWPAGEYRVLVHAPAGEPYLHAWRDIDWPTAAVHQSVELKLGRGVVVRGRLIEGPAGTPVAGAWAVYHQTIRNNARYKNLLSTEAVSGPDGTFTMVVPRGPGHVLVQGPSDDYLHVETNSIDMGIGLRPSFHLYPDAHAVLDINDSEATHPLELRLRRGVTVTGRVVAPDGTPVSEASMFGRSYTPYREHGFPLVGFNGDPPRIEVKDGRFEIPGCDPDKPSTFYFIDLKNQLGATVELSGKSAAAGPVTVRLERAATARILIKDAAGKPLAKRELGDWPYDLKLVITPGPGFEEAKDNIDLTQGDFAYQVDLDPFRDRGLRSGPDGRVTMVNLIPGARYRLGQHEFTPLPSQTVDLDVVLTQKPPG
ncbi:MAG: sigma-70 family RNA polymerase sigma factor [Isosphaeraceae bacterium]